MNKQFHEFHLANLKAQYGTNELDQMLGELKRANLNLRTSKKKITKG